MLVTKDVNKILMSKRTIAIFINNSSIVEFLSHEGIQRKFAMIIPASYAITYPISELPITFTIGE